MPRIDINQSSVEQHSSAMSNASGSLAAKSAGAFDDESTIAGNEASRTAFEMSQNALAKLGEALQCEANKIAAVGNDFGTMDKELATLVKLATE